jgi:hypothetical protein
MAITFIDPLPINRRVRNLTSSPTAFKPKAPRGGYQDIEAVRHQSGMRIASKVPALTNPGQDIRGALADIAADYDAQRDLIAAEFNSQLSGMGDGGAGAAIAEALKLIKDVQANRAAIQGVYTERNEFIDPMFAEAIQAAKDVVTTGAPMLEGIAAQNQAGITESFDTAEDDVLAAAELINAGDAAAQSVVFDTVDGEALRIAAAMQEAVSAENILGLSAQAHEAGAISERDLDKEQMTRRSALLNMEFDQMEDAAQAQLAAARRAAAAAAARRRALASQRNAALAELDSERAQAMRLNPHEAGSASAMNFLQKEARSLDYNRQQLIVSTVGNALSEQVPNNRVFQYNKDKGLGLNPTEVRIVQNALKSYTMGMRYQQDRDRQPWVTDLQPWN